MIYQLKNDPKKLKIRMIVKMKVIFNNKIKEYRKRIAKIKKIGEADN